MDSEPTNEAPYRLIRDCRFGDGVVVYGFTNLYGCTIGDRSQVGTFVEIQAGAVIGSDCKVQSHTFICAGVRIGDGVFIGHGVTFVNDKRPLAVNPDRSPRQPDDWELLEVSVGDGASIGSGALILGGVRVGAGAMVGAGAVVTGHVADGSTVVGNPSRPVRGSEPTV